MASAVKLLDHETIEQESCRAQAGRFYHWNRTYLIRKDGEIYSIVLSIFHRIAKVFVEIFNGNYFSRFFKVEVLNHLDIQAIVAKTSQGSTAQLSEEGADKRTEILTRERILPDTNSGTRMCGSGQTYENLVDLRYSDPDIALVTDEESSSLLEAARKCNRARLEMGTQGNCHLWIRNPENDRYHRNGASEDMTAQELVQKYSVMLFLSNRQVCRQLDFSADGIFSSLRKILHERALGDQAFEFASVFVKREEECEFKRVPYRLNVDGSQSKETDIGYERFSIADSKDLPLVLRHMRFLVKV